MKAEPVTDTTPRPISRSLLAQWWKQVTFVHWRVEPDAIGRLLPSGTRPDVFDGSSYVGLVAFRMVRTRLLGLPPVPYLGTFTETNVRLYSVDEHGRRGVVFLSMDADRLIPVLVAKTLLRLPYRWSRMSLTTRGDTVEYRCRPGRSGPESRLITEVGAPIEEPSQIDRFLTARWGLHHRHRYLANEHRRWPLHRARLLEWDARLVAKAGLPGVADHPPADVLYSSGVYTRFGPIARADTDTYLEPDSSDKLRP